MNTTINISSVKLNELLDKAFTSIYNHYKTIGTDGKKYFKDYLETKLFEFSKIKPIGFFDPVNLLDIYVPLTLEKNGAIQIVSRLVPSLKNYCQTTNIFLS